MTNYFDSIEKDIYDQAIEKRVNQTTAKNFSENFINFKKIIILFRRKTVAVRKFALLLINDIKNNPSLAEIKDEKGNTFIHLAAKEGFFDICTEALKINPNLAKIQNSSGNTFLHHVAGRGNFAVCKEARKINPKLLKITNKAGESVLDILKYTEKLSQQEKIIN